MTQVLAGELAFALLLAIAWAVQSFAIASGTARGLRAWVVLIGWGVLCARTVFDLARDGALPIHPALMAGMALLAAGTVLYRLQRPEH